MNNLRTADRKITKRIDLNVGAWCNLRCTFCYYKEKLSDSSSKNNLTTKKAKRLIDLYKKSGMEVLEFTGGEPTIREDIFELISYAKKAGFKKISMITNGLTLSSMDFASKITGAGASDFLFSIHGPTPETHDSLTGIKGSFSKLCEGIENIKNLGAKVRCNSVVTGKNASYVFDIARLCYNLGVSRINFIIFNPLEQARCLIAKEDIKYSEAAPILRKTIDEFGKKFEKFIVRYMPLCLMEGYEKYVHNVQQVHYDHDEWNYLLRTRIRQPFCMWLGAVLAGYLFLPTALKLNRTLYENKHSAVLNAHSLINKTRTKKCRNCKYYFICGGVWKAYYKLYGDYELNAVAGRVTYNITEFLDREIHGF